MREETVVLLRRWVEVTGVDITDVLEPGDALHWECRIPTKDPAWAPAYEIRVQTDVPDAVEISLNIIPPNWKTRPPSSTRYAGRSCGPSASIPTSATHRENRL